MSNEAIVYNGLVKNGYHKQAVADVLFEGVHYQPNPESEEISSWVMGNFSYDMTEAEVARFESERRLLSMMFQVARHRNIIDMNQMNVLLSVLNGGSKCNLLELRSWLYHMFDKKPELRELWQEAG